MARTRKYKTRRRGGNKSCRQNEQNWLHYWSPSNKRGLIPWEVKNGECCKEFDKNTRYYGLNNIVMNRLRYPQINGMNHECDDYMPRHKFFNDRNNYTEATTLNSDNDPFYHVPFANVSPGRNQPRFTGTADPLAQEVLSSDAPYADVVPALTPTQEAEQRRLQEFLYR
jgi:hypothetical protein